jgi:hypothetical protein
MAENFERLQYLNDPEKLAELDRFYAMTPDEQRVFNARTRLETARLTDIKEKITDTIAAIPTTVKTTEISAATISAKSDDIFIQIGEKLCGSISDIVKEKQSVIIENINKTITSHLGTDSEFIVKKIEDTINKIPNEEELIKSVNEKNKSVVDKEIERTLANPATFNKLKEKLKSITDRRIVGGTRKYKSNKSNRNKLNKRKKSLKRKQ